MKLLRHREKINTECSFIEEPILNVKAIKIDAEHNSLKKELGCKNLKSCDYFKKHKKSFYFFAKLERELTRHYCPTHLTSIKVIPYPKLETLLK